MDESNPRPIGGKWATENRKRWLWSSGRSWILEDKSSQVYPIGGADNKYAMQNDTCHLESWKLQIVKGEAKLNNWVFWLPILYMCYSISVGMAQNWHEDSHISCGIMWQC